MQIGGFQKFTLLDYPGKLAATVFTVGCSFRCLFCHNPELVLGNKIISDNQNEKDFFDFLQTRKEKIEGVCITGGEPTIQPDILDFMKKIKSAGFLVKLDTNGTRPDVLKKAIDSNLVDYVAMDIKNSLKKYEKTVGVKPDLDRIKLSVNIIRSSKIEYEFRTTVVPALHTEKDFDDIIKWIGGSKRYFLQNFRDFRVLNPVELKKMKSNNLNLEKIEKKLRKHFGETGIRG